MNVWKYFLFILLAALYHSNSVDSRKNKNAKFRRRFKDGRLPMARSSEIVPPFSSQFVRFDPGDRDNLTSGRIEVYINNSFTSICTESWDINDAHVACKHLGFLRGAARMSYMDSILPGTARYSEVKMTQVQCGQSESSLQDCRYKLSASCTTNKSVRVECRPNTGCPEDWIAGPTGCYQITPNTVTRREFAVNKCKSRGGHLINIETEAEQNFLSSALLEYARNGPLITGGIRIGHEWSAMGERGQWVWETLRDAGKDDDARTLQIQIPIEFRKWFPGWGSNGQYREPSNEKKKRCLYLTRSFLYPNGSDTTLSDLYWVADHCKSTRKRLKSGFNYICEKPLGVREDVGCYNGTGSTYRGIANKTERGSPCMNWRESAEINPETYPDMGLGDHNYCRNPDNDDRPWCWVGQNNFGFCDIPVCTDEEEGTGELCKDDQFNCNDGSCIPMLWHCDYEYDCESQADEGELCDYKLDLFRRTKRKTIKRHAEETYAGTTNETCARYCLNATKFLCQSFSYNSDSRECHLSAVNSDTHKTKSARNENYYELKTQLGGCDGMYTCDNGRCVDNDVVCDDKDDCGDFSDEYSCDSGNAAANTVEVRLRGGKGGRQNEGRVEVKYKGEWGVVCDDRWDTDDARVICRMMGFTGEAEALDEAYFGEGNGKFMLDEVECIGNETSLDQCKHDGWKTHDCLEWETAGVRCTKAKECPKNTEFQCIDDKSCLSLNKFCDTDCDCLDCSDENCDLQIDLVGGRNPSEGRVHISFGNKNGTVCDDNFDDLAATVVCKSLGYISGIAVENSLFGPGKGIVWMDNVICKGTEEHIIDCPHLGPLDNDCGHDEDVGVICREKNDLTVELVGGPDEYSGRVEIIKDDERGTICDDDWDNKDATVICKMLGFRGGRVNNTFGGGSESIHIFLDNVRCTGSEESIDACGHDDWLVHNCEHEEDAGVTCFKSGASDSLVSDVTTAEPTTVKVTTSKPDCFDGGYYKGTTSETEQGYKCQEWSRDTPHEHKYHEEAMFPDDSVAEASNYCRNPDGDPQPWCYTKDPNERWGYCDIPKCVDNCYTIASDYTGSMSVSTSGKKCQTWDSNTPHQHRWHDADAFPDKSIRAAGNQCRAPDDDVTPWCYTTDPDKRWEYCDIPRCGGFDYNVTCGLRPLQSRARRDVKQEEEFGEDDHENPLYRRKGRIVGGTTASYGMIPWQVSIRLKQSQYMNDHSHHCGGILIGEYWILSAAHCFRDVYKGEVVITLGDHHTDKRDKHEQLFRVAAMFLHDKYKRYDFDYDIALLKIRPINGRGIVFNDHVQPACLPKTNTLYKDGQKCIISGWGVYKRGQKSSYLKAARVPLVDFNTCNKLYKYSLTPRMTCAGYLVGGTDSCAGDSGGPLVCEIDDKFIVLGVTSFGDGCGHANSPGVYTRVASFIPWIEKILAEES